MCRIARFEGKIEYFFLGKNAHFWSFPEGAPQGAFGELAKKLQPPLKPLSGRVIRKGVFPGAHFADAVSNAGAA